MEVKVKVIDFTLDQELMNEAQIVIENFMRSISKPVPARHSVMTLEFSKEHQWDELRPTLEALEKKHGGIIIKTIF